MESEENVAPALQPGSTQAGVPVPQGENTASEAAAEATIQEKSLASYFPADTCIYLEIDDIPAALENFNNSALGKLWAEPGVQAFLKKPLGKLEYRLSEGIFELSNHLFQGFEGIAPLLQERVAIGILFDPEKALGDAYAVMLAAEVSEELGSNLMISKLKSSYAGTNNIVTVKDGIAFLVIEYREGKNLLDFVEGKADSNKLNVNQQFLDTIAKLGKDPDLVAYCNSAIFAKSFQQEARLDQVEVGHPEADYHRMMTSLDAFGLFDFDCLGFSLTPDLSGYLTRTVVNSPSLQTGNSKGVFSFINNKPISEELLKAIPQDIISFNASRLNLDQLGRLGRAAGWAFGMDPQQMNNLFNLQILNRTGYDLERNIIAHLGDEIACICIDPEILAGVPYLGLNNMVAVMRVKDPKLVKNNLNTLARIFSFYLQNSGKGSGSFIMKRGEVVVRGVKIIYGGVLAPCFAMVDDLLIVASSPYAARLVIDTINGASPSIQEDEEYKQALTRLDTEGASAISFARKLDPYRNAPALGMFSPVMVASTGMSLIQASNPQEEALQRECVDKLLQASAGLAIFCSQNHEYPYSLGDIEEFMPDWLGNKDVYHCNTATYRYLGGPFATRADDDMVINWCRYSHPPGGYNVLYKDGHVGFMLPDELAAEHKRSSNLCLRENIEFNHNPPDTDGIELRFDPYSQRRAEDLNPFALLHDNPEAIEELLTTFELYRLPAKRTITKNLFPAAGIRKVDGTTLVFESHAPFPLLHAGGANNLTAASLYLADRFLTGKSQAEPDYDLEANQQKLEKLGQGLGQFFAKYNRMPARPKDLWKDGQGVIPDKEAFACPSRPKIGGGQWRSDYILLPVAQMATRDNTIIMVDKPLNLPAMGCCLYLDGQVEVVRADSDDTYARFVNALILNKNRELIRSLAPKCCNGDDGVYEYKDEPQAVDVF
ncbi:MAG: DUF3352 domain-containing protein [Planctomycetes bacterium]|nr:DUF3352 domain-containing protein [Planctomycetota bacterium]